MSETLSAGELVAELNHAEGVLPRHVWNQTIAGNWPRIQATIEALQAEVTTLRTALEDLPTETDKRLHGLTVS